MTTPALASPTDTGTPMSGDASPSAASAPASIPSSYFLTNEDAVTSVKLQSPWGDCWAFAIASAVESAILKKTQKIEESAAAETAQTDGDSTEQPPKLLGLSDTIDVSERAIAWLAHEVQTEASAGSQAGEGFYLVNPGDPSNQLAEGSFEMIESQFVARQSLVSESAVPYTYNGYDGAPPWYKTGTFEGASDDARTKDWSVDESQRTSLDLGWVVSGIYKMPNPAVSKLDLSTGYSTYTGYDAKATEAIKKTLMTTGAVAIALASDNSIPAEVSQGSFMDAAPSEHFTYSTWSQYDASDSIMYNHAVSIVGWDDSYSAQNFAGSASGAPPGDGAWLCKNNWGSDALYSSMGAAADSSRWGIQADTATGMPAPLGSTEGSEASGFFWLSYYDHSIHTPVAFDVTPAAEDFANIYQYDYLGASEYEKPAIYEDEVWVANVFTAKEIEILDAVSVQTFSPGDKVNVVVYTLPSDLDVDDMTANEMFERATKASHVSATYETPGIFTLPLARPLLLLKGQRFVVVEQVVTTEEREDGTLYEGSLLNLEMAFLSNIEGLEQSTMANVVANPGESFVCIPSGDWMDIDAFTRWFVDSQGLPADQAQLAFGNALAKAYTSDTSFAKNGQIYETHRL